MKAFIEKTLGICGKVGIKPKILLALILVLIIGIWIGKSAGPEKSEVETATTKTEAKSEVWTCSMHPQIKLPKPGLCPICNMDLIPLTIDDVAAGASMRQLTVSENAKELMDIEVAPVERKFVEASVRMVGKVDYDETNLAYITSWIPGRLDRLFVDYTGVPVRKGDHLVSLYSPELISAQEELLQAIKAIKDIGQSKLGIMREMTKSTANAAREKLRLWGLTSEQIAKIEETGKVSDHMTIYSPTSGIVIHKDAIEGMYVQTGTKIYTIADLSRVWIKLDAYESDLGWIRYGQDVEFTTVSYPGEIFKGTISFIDPILNERTRTVKVRVNVQNLDGKLKPGMFVKAVVKSNVAGGGKIMDAKLVGKWICPMHPEVIKEIPGKCDICQMPLVQTEALGYISDDIALAEKPLVVPATAVLITGTRAIVYVQVPDAEKPTFEGREIALGQRAGDYYLVRSGLEVGELVVVKGNFKIDSSLQILAKPSMMTPEGGGGAYDQMAVELPALAKHQIQTVIAKSKNIQKVLASENLEDIRNAFTELGPAVEKVDMQLLTGHGHMLWMEYSMRIRNDIVEGMEIKTLKEAKRVAGSLADNTNSLTAKLGLTHATASHRQSSVSDQFRVQLAKIFDAYFAIQLALTEDNTQTAGKAVEQLSSSLKAVDMKLLSGDDHDRWMRNSAQLKQILSKSTDVDDIKLLREDFYLLSQQLTRIAKHFGSVGKTPFYILHCPMAFDNTGANWLQADDQTLNPYFGQMMLRCGGVEEVIAVKEIWKQKDK